MRSLLRILLGFILVVAMTVGALFYFQPRLPLAPAIPFFTFIWNRIAASELSVSGRYYFVPKEWGIITIQEATIGLKAEDGSKVDLIINQAETQLHLPSLVLGELWLDGISLSGVNISTQPSREQQEVLKESSHALFFPGFIRQTGPITLTDIAGSIIMDPAGNTTDFLLENVSGVFGISEAGYLDIKGSLNRRTLGLHIETGPLMALNEHEPLTFSGTILHKSLKVKTNGQLIYDGGLERFHADVSLAGDHLNDLTTLLGQEGTEDIPFHLESKIEMTPGERVLEITAFTPGFHNVTATFQREYPAEGNPISTVRLEGEQLNMDAILKFVGSEQQRPGSNEEGNRSSELDLDKTILAEFADVDGFNLQVHLKQIQLGTKRYEGLDIAASVRRGTIEEAPFSIVLDNAQVHGHFSLDVSGDTPQMSAHISTREWDIGSMLEELELAIGLDLSIENVETELSTSGWSIRELFTNLQFKTEATNGHYSFTDKNTGASLPVSINTAHISAIPGDSISARFVGEINSHPVTITVDIDDRRDEPAENVDEVIVVARFKNGDTLWKLEGQIPLPYQVDKLIVQSELSGKKTDDLNSLLDLDLPAIGPYRLSGLLQFIPEGYQLNQLEAEIGTSYLSGKVELNTKAIPPNLMIDLVSKQIQLNDFRTAGGSQPEKENDPQQEQSSNRKVLTDQDIVDEFNATVSIQVKNVLSGNDYLGSGLIKYEQKDGQVWIRPLEIAMPHGDVAIDFYRQPYGENLFYAMDIDIEELDYGVVGRWYQPDTDMAGTISIMSYLQGVSPDFETLLANSSGAIDFAIQPYQMRAGVIDIWALNLLRFLTPLVTSDEESKYNCAAGRFNLDDGILNHESFLIDTSRVQVKGTVEVDFRKGWIDAVFRPIPKRPQFLSLATPIRVNGSLDDLNVGIARGGILGTVVRFVTSYIVVPLQWVILERVPEDDTHTCLQLFNERVTDKP